VSLNNAITSSGGILELQLLNAIDGDAMVDTVNMRQQVAVAF